MDGSIPAHSYIALTARLETLAEHLSTRVDTSRRPAQDLVDPSEDNAESSTQAHVSSGNDESQAEWDEVESILNKIADGLRDASIRKPLAQTSLPSLLTTLLRLSLSLGPLASSSTASAIIEHNTDTSGLELPAVQDLAIADAAQQASTASTYVPLSVEAREELTRREPVGREVGRVAANICIDDDENRQILATYQYHLTTIKVFHAYASQPEALKDDCLGTLKPFIASILNLSIGSVDSIKLDVLHPLNLAVLLTLANRLYNPVVIEGDDVIKEQGNTEERQALCGWLWRIFEESLGVEKSGMTLSIDRLVDFASTFAYFNLPHSDAIAEPTSSGTQKLLLDMLNTSCAAIESFAYATSDNLQKFMNRPDGVELLRKMLAFIEFGDVPQSWVASAEDSDSDSAASASSQLPNKPSLTLREKAVKKVGLAKAALIKVLVELCGEVDMAGQEAEWFWEQMHKWVGTGKEGRRPGRADLADCAFLCFGNLARTETACVTLLSPASTRSLLKPIMAYLVPAASAQTKHALIGLLKNLSIAKPNKALLGQAGLIERLCDLGIWLEAVGMDMLGSVQGGGVGIVKHLCHGNLDNSLRVANTLSLTTQDGPLHQLTALLARTDDPAIKCETARIFVNIIKTIYSPSTEKMREGDERLQQATAIMASPTIVKALLLLIDEGKKGGFGILVGEGVMGLVLSMRNEEGAKQVTDCILSSTEKSSPISPNLSLILSITESTAAGSESSLQVPPELLSNVYLLLLALERSMGTSTNISDKTKSALRQALQKVKDDGKMLVSAEPPISMPSSASSSPPTQTQVISSFATGIVDILDLWPALRLAVVEQWGGLDSEDKRTWMASALVDAFEEALPNPQADGTLVVLSELPPPLDEDELVDMLLEMLSEEFDTELEDGSPELVSKDILKLWKEVCVGSSVMLNDLAKMVAGRKGKKVQAVRSGNSEDEETSGEDEDWEEDDEEGEGDAAPQLVARDKKEVVVDEEGFTLVQGKGGK